MVGSIASLVVFFAAMAAAAESGNYEITALGGVGFGGSTDLELGDGSLDAGASYGAMLAARVRRDGLVALSYTRQRTEFDVALTGGGSQRLDVDVGYVQFGGELEFHPTGRRIVPFIGLSLGASHFSPRGGGRTEWFFAGTFTGGLKIPLTEHVGLRAQMRVMGTLIDGKSDIFCVGAGGVTCVVAGSADGLFQGDALAGIYVTF